MAHPPHHPHAHHHGHGHAHPHADAGTRSLGLAVTINLALTAAQVIGGIAAGSLGLIADALHNFSDAAGLLLALIARRIARRPPDADRTFGYGRAEIVGGLMNLTAIIVIAGWLAVEAVTRAVARPAVDGWLVVIIAGIALLVDVGTAMLTYAHARRSVNIRAAFLHNIADALASVGVIVSGTLIILFQWYWTDLVATLAISLYIVWMSIPPMRRCIAILMQSVPAQLSIEAIAAELRSIDRVRDVYHVHAWPIDEHRNSLEARIVLGDISLAEAEQVGDAIRARIRERFGIDHLTLEFRTTTEAECASGGACI